MESRMEKFYRKDLSDYSRSKKNANLYKEVYGSYGNMEHLPVSENSSEISMSDLQNMVSSREQYKKAKMVEEFTNTSVKLKEEPKEAKVTAKKVYDINELIEKARSENAKAKEMLSNTSKQPNFLQTLEVSPEALNRIKEKSNGDNKINSSTESFPLDLLSDLKPSGNTVVMEPMSDTPKSEMDDIPIDSTFIKKDKELELKESKEDFYSDSYSFSKKDFFDDSDDILANESGHAVLKVLVFILGIALLVAIGYFCFMYFGMSNA